MSAVRIVAIVLIGDEMQDKGCVVFSILKGVSNREVAVNTENR